MPTAEQLAEYMEMSEATINLGDAKNRLSQLVSELTPEMPVLLSVRNRPRAAILEISSYIDLLAKAEAYEHIRLADEAEAGETMTIEQGREYVRRRRAELRAVRQRGELIL